MVLEDNRDSAMLMMFWRGHRDSAHTISILFQQRIIRDGFLPELLRPGRAVTDVTGEEVSNFF